MKRILLLDDDINYRKPIAFILRKQGYEVIECDDGPRALEQIRAVEDLALALIDMRIPTAELEEDPEGGLEVIKALKTYCPHAECIVMTAYGSIPNVVQAMQLGASNCLVKQETMDELFLEIVRQALEKWELRQNHHRLQAEVQNLREQFDEKFGMANIIGQSKLMRDVFQQIRLFAPKDITVLITGESGVGKELIAKAIHNNSPRKNKPFKAINCSRLRGDLLSSELFGHERGAFSGAVARHHGIFEQADGGTLFLDEIGGMEYKTQANFLRVLEDGQIMRVGGEKPIQVDVRLIAATNKNLEEAVENETFREDLYHRINRFRLRVHPLKERREDIPLLVSAFIKEFSQEHNEPVTKITPEAMAYLKNADWPGNVRQLRNVIESAVILSPTDTIELTDLPPKLQWATSPSQPYDAVIEEIVSRKATLKESEEALKRALAIQALRDCHGKKSRAAKQLGMNLSNFIRLMKRLGISESDWSLRPL